MALREAREEEPDGGLIPAGVGGGVDVSASHPGLCAVSPCWSVASSSVWTVVCEM